ncbi:MAG: carbohydrate kinase [Verrucomicrobiae bacterium]|nr:carbohydrate kinase [Verrucomicrobiae bacterium]
MSPARFAEITARYPLLHLGLLGDYCLDRYLEIDPGRTETSIETGLPVHNVVRVRSQPGGAGTILNNLVALGIGRIDAIGFYGDDGEGYELRRALGRMPHVRLDHFRPTSERRTFTYCKPLVLHPNRPPEELSRLDSKNWDPTPQALEDQLIGSLQVVASSAHAVITLEQVDQPDTGVVTRRVRDTLAHLASHRPDLLILADSRRGLTDWPSVGFKMNAPELAALLHQSSPPALPDILEQARQLARARQRPVIVTLAERGAVGALAEGDPVHIPALPILGPIDVVGAGDAVTANVTAALASGASLREALELAMAAAHIVVHQLGTTGTATVAQLRDTLAP